MARVQLMIADPVNRMTLRAILAAEGHTFVEQQPEAILTDDLAGAGPLARQAPCLVLARAGDIRDAVAAMREGVYGYLFVPFQPGEAGLMVQRALEWWRIGRRGNGETGERREEESRIQDVEAQLILTTLRRCKGNRTKAARMLGIGRNTLWRKLKRIEVTARGRLPEEDE